MMSRRPFICTIAVAVFALAPTIAHAGSQSTECVSKAKTIKVSTKTSDVKITYLDQGKKALAQGQLSLQPDYEYTGKGDEQVITVIPISTMKVLAEKESHMHVVHKDGTSCNGREMWDTKYTQLFVLTAAHGSALIPALHLSGQKVEGQTKEGYVVVEMTCDEEGVTSPGGCRAEDVEDEVTVVKDK